MNRTKQNRLALVSMLGFVLLWALVTDAWQYSALLPSWLSADTRSYLYGYCSRILWMLPAFWLIDRFPQQLVWPKQQLFSRPKAEPLWLVFVALTTGYALVSLATGAAALRITGKTLAFLILKLLLVGLGEELVFRGWCYNLLQKVCSGICPVLLSALGFTALHWPAYLIKGVFYGRWNWAGFWAQSLSVLVCGLLFALMLKRSGTLWNPISAHFYYDLVLELIG